jgi:hypothetical protein
VSGGGGGDPGERYHDGGGASELDTVEGDEESDLVYVVGECDEENGGGDAWDVGVYRDPSTCILDDGISVL